MMNHNSGVNNTIDNTVEPLSSGHFGTKKISSYYRGFLNLRVIGIHGIVLGPNNLNINTEVLNSGSLLREVSLYIKLSNRTHNIINKCTKGLSCRVLSLVV